MLDPREQPRPVGRGRRVIVVLIALGAAVYLTWLAIDFVSGGCDCGSSAAGVIRTALIVAAASALYLAAAAMALRVLRPRD